MFALSADSTLLIDGPGGRWLIAVRDSFVGVIPGDAPVMTAGFQAIGADAKRYVFKSRPARPLERVVGSISTERDSSWLLRVDRVTGHVDSLLKFGARPARIEVQGTV